MPGILSNPRQVIAYHSLVRPLASDGFMNKTVRKEFTLALCVHVVTVPAAPRKVVALSAVAFRCCRP
jgi:hypothetical protein